MRVPVWSETIGAGSGWNASSGYGPHFIRSRLPTKNMSTPDIPPNTLQIDAGYTARYGRVAGLGGSMLAHVPAPPRRVTVPVASWGDRMFDLGPIVFLLGGLYFDKGFVLELVLLNQN